MAQPMTTNPLHAAPQTFPIVETPHGPMIHAYNLYWPIQNDICLQLNAFRLGIKKEDGGLGKVRHLFEAKHLIWPESKKTLNPWMVRRYQTFCAGHKVVTLAGGAGSAKSYDCAYYALLWWWANPAERAVLVASTTIGALKKRIWGYISDGFSEARGNMPGHRKTNPNPIIQFDRHDERHAIAGIALREGEAERTLREYIGIHPKEALLFIVDEATDVSPAISDAIANLDKGGVDFQMICIGNSKSKLDPHGRLSRPRRGWTTVDPDIDEEWETEMGVCLYFDCYKSPAVTCSYKDKLPFLINEAQIRSDEERLGKSDPKFWRFTRGFWPPDDLARTILTLSMIEKHHASEAARWSGAWKIRIGALDPAFTSEGDECIFRIAEMGQFEDGTIGIDFGGKENIINLQLDARSREPISYQIVKAAREECERYGIEPAYFGMDTWGFGMGAGDILEKEWSPEICRINSVGNPTGRRIDSEIGNIARDLYDRYVTEMWFSIRSFVQSDQIRGLDEVSAEEFCSREYKWKARKLRLETKREFKVRMGREDSPTGSPDRADAAALILEVARINGLELGRRQSSLVEQHDWEKKWEEQRGHKGLKENDREEMWQSDGIMDSMSFGVFEGMEDGFAE